MLFVLFPVLFTDLFTISAPIIAVYILVYFVRKFCVKNVVVFTGVNIRITFCSVQYKKCHYKYFQFFNKYHNIEEWKFSVRDDS